MPRKDDSARTRQTDPDGPEDTVPGHATEPPPDAWLENPRNIQAFFEAVERARKAKGRERPS
jgi:hypothetical protein